MKVLLYSCIIVLLWVFANPLATHADSGYLAEILEISTKTQELELEKITLTDYNFSQADNKESFRKFEWLHQYLKAYFLQEYKKWDINYYAMNDIISSFWDFSFYADRVFYYGKQKEIFGNQSDLQNGLIKAHASMRSSYYKLIISLKKY